MSMSMRQHLALRQARPRWRMLQVEVLELRMCPAVQVQYAVTQDWGSGFQAQMSLVNNQTTSLAPWQLAFDYTPSITSIWDARIISHVGNHYVIGGADWNKTVAAGGSVSFGFIGSPGHVTAGPANIV